MKSSNVDPQKMSFELYTKYTEKVHGSKLGHQNGIPIPLCVTELIHSIAPEKCGRCNGFWYADGKIINQLDECKSEDDKVFHIPMELLDENTDLFIEKLPNPSAWEISNSEKQSTMRQLNICFNNLDTFIETMCNCYDNMTDLHCMNENEIKVRNWRGNEKKC